MKLYVGTYKKYNEGSLDGKWLDLDDYSNKDEFIEACLELHKDEEDPELMFQDYECDSEWERQLYSESSVPDEYWEIKEELSRSHFNEEIYDAWIKYNCVSPTVDNINQAEEEYVGDYKSDADFAESWYDDTETTEIKNHPLYSYIDWEEVFNSEFDCNGVYSIDNHYFDSNRS